MNAKTKEDLKGIVGFIIEYELKDMIAVMEDEPDYVETGIITEAELETLMSTMDENDPAIKDIIDKACQNEDNLHVYALAYRVHYALLAEGEEGEV